MLRRIFAEWPTGAAPVVIATGGLAGIIAPFSSLIRQIEPDLTLRGLRIAASHLGLRW
jgi:pantothenate kinase type III